jgi:hypothetical protein
MGTTWNIVARSCIEALRKKEVDSDGRKAARDALPRRSRCHTIVFAC